MDAYNFKRLYSESRNGANQFYHHALARGFQYSDGVQELAQLGCYWLLDIMATEGMAAVRKDGYGFYTLTVKVAKEAAALQITRPNGEEPMVIWSRNISYTDLPEGSWDFFLCDEGTRVEMILPKEY